MSRGSYVSKREVSISDEESCAGHRTAITLRCHLHTTGLRPYRWLERRIYFLGGQLLPVNALEKRVSFDLLERQSLVRFRDLHTTKQQ